MTPKPQAKSIDEIIMGVWHEGYNRCNVEKNNKDGYDNYAYFISPEEATKAITQAMLDALPKKIKYTGDEIMGMKIAISEQQVADGFTFRSTKEIDAFNKAIDQMESAIKLTGGEK